MVRTVVGLICAALAVNAGQIAVASAEEVVLQSKTFTDRSGPFLGAAGTPIAVHATLNLPEGATVPVPGVIIGHASDGVTPDVQEVAKAARAAGFATLYYDSLKVRGGTSTRSSSAYQVQINQAADATAAFQALAADPRIDAKRIAYVGMSMGGGTAIILASKTLQESALGERRFAAHIAFFPGLHQAPISKDLSGAPILILQGDKDDYQYPERPRAYIDYIKKAAPDYPIVMEMIPDALHGFLSSNLSGNRYVGDYNNGSRCPIVLLASGGGSALNIEGQVVQTWDCKLTRGGTVG